MGHCVDDDGCNLGMLFWCADFVVRRYDDEAVRTAPRRDIIVDNGR